MFFGWKEKFSSLVLQLLYIFISKCLTLWVYGVYRRVILSLSSSNACCLRHIVVEGGKEKTIRLPADLQITNVTFDEEIADPAGRSVVKMQFVPIKPFFDEEDEDEEDEEKGPEMETTVLCALTPGKVCIRIPISSIEKSISFSISQIEQASVNLVLDEDGEFTFSVSGKKCVICPMV